MNLGKLAQNRVSHYSGWLKTLNYQPTNPTDILPRGL